MSTIGELLNDAVVQWPNDDALVVPDGRSWTFTQLRDTARQVAWALLGFFQPGDRVAIWSPNCAEWYLLQLGAGLAGMTVVTVNPGYSASELSDILRRSQASALFHARAFRGTEFEPLVHQVLSDLPDLIRAIPLDDWGAFLGAAVERPLPLVDPSFAAQIQFTSGTTGRPKGAMLPHRAIVQNGRAGAERWAVTPGELWLNAMPMFHVAGSVINALGALASGATQLLCPFEPASVAGLIRDRRVDIACLAGTMWSMLLAQPDIGLTSVRAAVAGGQNIAPELVRQVEDRIGGSMSILFGMTELCGTVTAAHLSDSDRTREETCGTPLPGVEVRISGGEVQVRGWLAMTGYFGDPAATAEAFTDDGWLRTGDVGTIDDRGRLCIRGRIKEMIIRGAENIYPAEIESRLRQHPAVGDVAVVGLPDDLYGEIVAAAVVLRPDLPRPAEHELIDWCRRTLAPEKTPRIWAFVPSLPMTPSGKVRKFMVRNDLQQTRAQR